MLAQAKQANATQASYVRQVALRSAIRTMKPAQVAGVRSAVDKLGAEADKSAFEAELAALSSDARVTSIATSACSATGGRRARAPGVKAAAMIALLGDAGTATKSSHAWPRYRSRAVRLAALGAVDHLVEKDGAAAADALMKIARRRSGRGSSNGDPASSRSASARAEGQRRANGGLAGVHLALAELEADAKQLVVLGDAIAARKAAGLDLAGVGARRRGRR